MTAQVTIHATAVVVGEAGVLIEGRSGSGKSTLALALLAAKPGIARLVGDDRIILTSAGGRLLARPHSRIAGMIERRGVGLLRVEHEPVCVVRLVVQRDAAPARLPAAASSAERLGVRLPACLCPAGLSASDVAALVLSALDMVNASGCFERLQSA